MADKKDKLLSVADVSKDAGISRQRILQIIESGDLRAEMVGRNYVILQSDFEKWNSSRREAGRPPKDKAEQSKADAK
ncbi:MAG TPA: helix-turn-helix domain-containing protein [Pyrinomonadaceae bacterium]|jgi:excisionase family DNA binding protein